MTAQLLSPPDGYSEWLKELKARIRSVQQKAVLAAIAFKKKILG